MINSCSVCVNLILHSLYLKKPKTVNFKFVISESILHDLIDFVFPLIGQTRSNMLCVQKQTTAPETAEFAINLYFAIVVLWMSRFQKKSKRTSLNMVSGTYHGECWSWTFKGCFLLNLLCSRYLGRHAGFPEIPRKPALIIILQLRHDPSKAPSIGSKRRSTRGVLKARIPEGWNPEIRNFGTKARNDYTKVRSGENFNFLVSTLKSVLTR